MKILLPVDGSETSNATLEWAARNFKGEDCRFYLLAVISDPMTAEYKVDDALSVLRQARATLEKEGLTVEKSEYLTGDAVQSICRYADDEDIDQILMGSHGRSGLAKTLLGSVSEGVLEHCRRTVFIYRRHLDQMSRSPL